jgi:hypothetical protein
MGFVILCVFPRVPLRSTLGYFLALPPGAWCCVSTVDCCLLSKVAGAKALFLFCFAGGPAKAVPLLQSFAGGPAKAVPFLQSFAGGTTEVVP